MPGLHDKSQCYFKEKGVASRVRFIGGEFNQSVPGGGDLYIMKAILHARADESAKAVLNQCKAVLPAQGKSLIIEHVIEKSEENYAEACVNDINMLNVSYGNVRTLREFDKLFNSAGLLIKNVYPVMNAITMMELEAS